MIAVSSRHRIRTIICKKCDKAGKQTLQTTSAYKVKFLLSDLFYKQHAITAHLNNCQTIVWTQTGGVAAQKLNPLTVELFIATECNMLFKSTAVKVSEDVM